MKTKLTKKNHLTCLVVIGFGLCNMPYLLSAGNQSIQGNREEVEKYHTAMAPLMTELPGFSDFKRTSDAATTRRLREDAPEVSAAPSESERTPPVELDERMATRLRKLVVVAQKMNRQMNHSLRDLGYIDEADKASEGDDPSEQLSPEEQALMESIGINDHLFNEGVLENEIENIMEALIAERAKTRKALENYHRAMAGEQIENEEKNELFQRGAAPVALSKYERQCHEFTAIIRNAYTTMQYAHVARQLEDEMMRDWECYQATINGED